MDHCGQLTAVSIEETDISIFVSTDNDAFHTLRRTCRSGTDIVFLLGQIAPGGGAFEPERRTAGRHHCIDTRVWGTIISLIARHANNFLASPGIENQNAGISVGNDKSLARGPERRYTCWSGARRR